MKVNTPETFWSRTRAEGSCVVWTGLVNYAGYGRISWDNRKVSAHRLAFFLRMGRWPVGLLRHLCDNPPCVLHVVEGTKSENGLDSVRAGTHHKANRTHCPWGHAYDEVNTLIKSDGRRVCRACNRRAARRQRQSVSVARSYPPAPGATSEPAGSPHPFGVRAPGSLHLS